jgi:hypothetical protein
MFIKLIVKKIIFILAFSADKSIKRKQLNQINNFVIKQIESLPTIQRLLFYLLTLCFIFTLFFTKNKALKLLDTLMTSNIFIVKKYLQSVQSLVFYYISDRFK